VWAIAKFNIAGAKAFLDKLKRTIDAGESELSAAPLRTRAATVINPVGLYIPFDQKCRVVYTENVEVA